MKSSRQNTSSRGPLVTGKTLSNDGETRAYRVELIVDGSHSIKTLGDLVQVVLDRSQARRDVLVVEAIHRLGNCRRSAATQDGRQVLRVPVKGDGQGFEGASAAAPLNGIAGDLTDNRLRQVRPFDQVTLSQPKLGRTLIDRTRDCSPIVRHVFLRAPPQRREYRESYFAG
jgi:hypothetical protein